MNFLTDVCKCSLCMFSRSEFQVLELHLSPRVHSHTELKESSLSLLSMWWFSFPCPIYWGGSHCIFLAAFSKNLLAVDAWGYFCNFYSIGQCVWFYANTYIVLAVNGCVICPEIMYCGFSMFVPFLQIALLICGLLCFPVSFRIVFLVLWRQ